MHFRNFVITLTEHSTRAFKRHFKCKYKYSQRVETQGVDTGY